MTSDPGRTLHADHALAARLEGLCANEMRRFAQTALALDPGCGADWIEIAGGIAAYAGADSPVNMSFGIGMSGNVSAGDIEALERFYTDRGTRAATAVCPLSSPSFGEALAERGWVLDGFEHVLVRGYETGDDFGPTSGVYVQCAESDEERALWALVAATGFSAPLPPLKAQLTMAGIAVARPGTQLFTAWVDGKAAGAGELYVEDGVAWLSADTTLPQFRRRGVQQALQARRLAEGAAAGCALAATECTPGSGSQRNMERAGFRIAYTRAELVSPLTVLDEEGTNA